MRVGFAHFKLEHPADWLVTDDNGDPTGLGTQKMNPCGAGTRSGLVTEVHAGATLHVKLIEAVPHGGHYRISLVPKLGPVSADLPEPNVTLQGGSCAMADVMSPVAPPVLADNLFPHLQATAVSGQVWETDVTLPQMTGDATLQIIEFMTPHAPQCFYHHCAQLRLVASNVDLGASGEVVTDGGVTDAGDTTSSSSSSSSGPSGAAAPSQGSSSGCSVEGSATPSLVTIAVGVFAAIAVVRRRR